MDKIKNWLFHADWFWEVFYWIAPGTAAHTWLDWYTRSPKEGEHEEIMEWARQKANERDE